MRPFRRSAALVAVAALAATVVLVPAQANAAAPGATESVAVGQLARLVSDGGPGSGVDRTMVRTADGDIDVPPELAAGIAPGATVAVHRDVLTGRPTGVRSLGPDGPPAISGTHKVVIVPVYDPTEVAAPADVSATLAASVAATDAYYDEATHGAIRLTVKKTYGWTQVAGVKACDLDAIESFVSAMVDADVTDNLTNVFVYTSAVADCPFAGIAYVGGNFLMLANYSSLLVVAHEFGHNLGLNHADRVNCTAGGAPAALSDTCEVDEYADRYDPMGNLGDNLFSAAHLVELGVIPPSGVQTVLETTTTHLAPAGSTSGIREVVVPVGGVNFSFDYHSLTGLDAAAAPDPSNGVLLRVTGDFVDKNGYRLGAETGLIDFTPADQTDGYELASGSSWTSPDGHWGISVGTVDATGADVTVTRGADVTPPTEFAIEDPAGLAFVSDPSWFLLTWTQPTDADSGLGAFDVLIDGSATLHIPVDGPLVQTWAEVPTTSLAVGNHTVAVRAVDRAGNTRTTAAVPFRFDPGFDPPYFGSKPRAALRLGAATARSVPVTVRWLDDADSGICARWIAGTTASKRSVPVANDYSGGTFASSQRPNTSTRWTATSRSCAGYDASSTGGASSAGVSTVSTKTSGFKGTWKRKTSSAMLGGSEFTTTKKGASFTFSFTGRGLGLVASKATSRGSLQVYVDGKKVATVSLRSSKTSHSLVVWTREMRAGKHKVKIVNLATKNRPTIGVDGIVRLA